MNKSDIFKCSLLRVSKHAFAQWARRVGPNTKSQRELEELLNNYLFQPDRVELLRRDCILLDKEIVAACCIRGSELIIESFFGRLSLNPKLENFNQLSHFIQREARSSGRRNSRHVQIVRSEGINLAIPSEELAKQNYPEFEDSVLIRVPSISFRVTRKQPGHYLVKQLSGNSGVGQEFEVDVKQLHKTYYRVQPRTLSHVHVARLCAKILNLEEPVS